jgi:hypothetical protein
MTHKSKIGRLPHTLRDQLNQRLDDGQDGDSVLHWLNALPEVKQRLKAYFDGTPITKQNLSEWRQAGFREWELRQELLEHAQEMNSFNDDMQEAVDINLLAGKLAAALTLRYAALLNTWDGQLTPEFKEQVVVLRALNGDLALLQKTMQKACRHKREFEQYEEDQQKKIEKEVKDSIVNPLWAMYEREDLTGILGGDERARKAATIITAVKYDLPEPANWKEPVIKNVTPAATAKSADKSKPVQP